MNRDIQQTTFLKEITTTLGRFTKSRERRYHATENESNTASSCFAHLIKDEEFVGRFGESHLTPPEEIGRGWHGVTYKIGDYVMKIQHAVGPVKGFEYPQTRDGAQLANTHLKTLQKKAHEHNLEHLVPLDQEVYFVPLGGDKGRVVTIQQFYNRLFLPNDINKIQLSQETRTKLLEEFERFMEFYVDCADNEGLLNDVFGKGNVALREVNGEHHFLLLDVGPVDTGVAGPIAKVGMSAAFIKEIVKWEIALGGRRLRREQRDV